MITNEIREKSERAGHAFKICGMLLTVKELEAAYNDGECVNIMEAGLAESFPSIYNTGR